MQTLTRLSENLPEKKLAGLSYAGLGSWQTGHENWTLVPASRSQTVDYQTLVIKNDVNQKYYCDKDGTRLKHWVAAYCLMSAVFSQEVDELVPVPRTRD